MATNLNITANSTSVSSNNFSITVTDNNTGNVVNISPPTSPIVSISAAGILGNPGKDSDIIAGESVIFQHITASGEISASGIVYGSQINIGGGIFTSASLAAAEASGDNLGNHIATQNLNLDGNSLLDGLNITASGGIRANNVDVGDVSGISSIYDLRVGGGGIRTSGTGYFYGISNPGSYTGAGRITLSDPNAYIQIPSYVSASRAILTQITASSHISSSGAIYAAYITSDAAYVAGDTRVIYNLSNTINLGDTDAGSPDKAVKILATNIELDAPVTASSHISASGTVRALDMRVGSGYDGIIRFGPTGDKNFPQFRQSEANQLLLERGSGENLVKFNFSQHSDGPKVIVEGHVSSSGKNIAHSFIATGNDANLALYGTPDHQNITGSNKILFTSPNFEFGVNNISNVGQTSFMYLNGDLDVRSHITASGNISASGDIIAEIIYSDKQYRLLDSGGTSRHFIAGPNSSVVSNNSVSIGNANFSEGIQIINDITASGNISASGNLNAANITTPGTLTVGHLEATTINTLQLTSSIVTSSIIFSSGSNIFGDEISDTHTFNGHITASGNISSSNLITATSGAFSYIQGNSPLTINPDQLIVTPNDYFQVLTNTTTSSIFISQSSGNIGFNTNDPQTGFDAIVNEAQFQQPGTRTGLKINDEGNIESFSKDATTAATGSEFVLRYSRGVSITQNSLSTLNIDVVDDAAATQYFNDLQPRDQNVILEKLEILGFITPPQVGDVLGSIRFLAESGSSVRGEGYDDRTTGETAVIKAVVSEGDSTGIQSDMIFSVAGKTGGAVQQFLLDANGEHQMTGSLSLNSVKINGVLQSKTNLNSTIGFAALSGDDDIEFKPDGYNMLTLAPDLINFNSGYANADFKVNGNSGIQAALGNIFIFGDVSADSGKGYLGVGTGSPTERLQVEGNVSASGEFIGASANITNITASIISASALIEGIGFRASGNSGFGGQLHVGGTITTGFNTGQIFKATGTAEFTSHITSSGNISASGDLISSNIYLPGEGRISFDNESTNDQYITGTDNALTIVGDNRNNIRATTETRFQTLAASTYASIKPGGIETVGHITASGNISASGDLMVNNINGTINGGTF